jgi:peptide/nickel transport system substrate-binding protein
VFAPFLAVALVAAACGGSSKNNANKQTSTTGNSPTSNAAKATGQISPGVPTDYDPNGQLTFAYTTPGNSLDPHLGPGGAEQTYMFPIYDRLTSIDDNFQVQPMLATSWSFAPDGSYLEMKLRTDVTFHDGTPFDANAVKANIERAKGPKAVTAVLLRAVNSVQVVDQYTVRLLLSGGGAELPSILATPPGMMLSPKAIADPTRDLANNPGDAGSGPYKVVQFVPGVKTVYVQAQPPGTHWDKGAGLLKGFTWEWIGVAAQRINGIKAGDLDMASITGADVPAARTAVDNTTILSRDVQQSVTSLVLMLRSTNPPLNNVKLRQAIEYAIDKNAIATGLYSGACAPATQFYPSDHWAYSQIAASRYTYDQAMARQLVTESGVNPSFTASYLSQYQQPAEAMQAQLKAVSINMTLKPIPSAQIFSTFRDNQLDALVTAINGTGDPSYVLNNSYLGGIPHLVADGTEKTALQQQVSQASNPLLSQPDRAKLYNTIFGQLADDALVVHVCFGHHLTLYRSNVGGVAHLLYPKNGLVDSRYLYAKKK